MIVDDNKLYATNIDNLVNCFDINTGDLIFNKEMDIRCIPAIDDECFYWCDEEMLYCIDKVTWKEIWKAKHSCMYMSSIILYDGNIFYTSKDNQIICVSKKDGNTIWCYKLKELRAYLTLSVSRDYIVAIDNEKLVCLDEGSGTLKWEIKRKFERAVILNDSVFAINGNNLSKIDLSHGTVNWKNQLQTNAKYLTVSDDKVFCTLSNSEKSFLLCFDVEGGKKIWEKEIINGSYTPLNPVYYDGQIYYNSGNSIVCSEAITGKDLWQFKVAGGIVCSTVVCKDKAFIYSSEEYENLYCIDAKTGCQALYLAAKAEPATPFKLTKKTGFHIANVFGFIGIIDGDKVVWSTPGDWRVDEIVDPRNEQLVYYMDFNSVIIMKTYQPKKAYVAIEKKTGKKVWEQDAESTWLDKVENNTLIFNNNDNRMIKLDATTGKYEKSIIKRAGVGDILLFSNVYKGVDYSGKVDTYEVKSGLYLLKIQYPYEVYSPNFMLIDQKGNVQFTLFSKREVDSSKGFRYQRVYQNEDFIFFLDGDSYDKERVICKYDLKINKLIIDIAEDLPKDTTMILDYNWSGFIKENKGPTDICPESEKVWVIEKSGQKLITPESGKGGGRSSYFSFSCLNDFIVMTHIYHEHGGEGLPGYVDTMYVGVFDAKTKSKIWSDSKISGILEIYEEKMLIFDGKYLDLKTGKVLYATSGKNAGIYGDFQILYNASDLYSSEALTLSGVNMKKIADMVR